MAWSNSKKSAGDVQRDAAGRVVMHALIAGSAPPRTRACAALGASRATGYRHGRPVAARAGARKASHHRLPDDQRTAILAHLHSPRFCDQTPAHTYHTLLGEGTFLCSIRTLQRLLKDAGEAAERRPIRPPQTHAVPRLEATAPNQVWTWDITKLAPHERPRGCLRTCLSTCTAATWWAG